MPRIKVSTFFAVELLTMETLHLRVSAKPQRRRWMSERVLSIWTPRSTIVKADFDTLVGRLNGFLACHCSH